MEDDECDTILCLIDELKSEDHATKIHAINSLEVIAQAIGEERTREELVPYVTELLDDDNEEVLTTVATKLGDLLKYVGTPSQMACLLPPLNTLASNEENNVREKAVASLNSIAQKLDPATIKTHYLPLLNSLATNDWYSARIASCSLFAVIFEKLPPDHQNELIKLFIELGKDDTPMVRRAAASNLGALCSLVSNADLGKLLDQLSADEHDSVRQATLESVAKVIERYPDLLQLVKKVAKDKSWRVRYTLVEHLAEYLSSFSSALPIVNEIVGLLNDSEPEVKCIALSSLSHVIEKLDESNVNIYILPTFEKLSKDSSQYVRLSLVQAICQTSSHFGIETCIQKLLPIVNTLIKDESFDVRISFADNMHSFNAAIGPEKVLSYSIPLILQMMKDNQWRLRLKVVECLPQVAEMAGVNNFNEQLVDTAVKWVEDCVFAVREATLESFKQISALFGDDWTKTWVLPIVQELAKSQVFMRRMTALSALNKFGPGIGVREWTSMLELLADDTVPNIKFNVAKVIRNHAGKAKGQNFTKVLEKLKGDADSDVKYYAEAALKDIGKR